MKRIFTLLSLLAFSVLGAVSAQGTIKFGYIGGLSGGTAAFGVPAHEGVQFAVNEINAAGGINGAQIELVSYDDQGDPFNAQQGISRLSAQGVDFIVSGSSSAGALAQVPRLYEEGVVAITPLGSDPAITQKNTEYDGAPAMFTNIPNNTELGASIARFAADELDVKTVAVFVRDDAYGQSIAAGFEAAAAAAGIEVTRRVTYPVSAQDFSSDLAVVISRRPDAIFLSGYAPDSGLIARQARLYGFSGPLLATNPVTAPQYTEVAADAAVNTYVSSALNMGGELTAVEEQFYATWNAATGNNPNSYQLGAYDSVYLLKAAIEAVGTDVDAVRAYLGQVAGYAGVSGTITFNDDGSATKPIYFVRYDQGAWTQVAAQDD